MIWILELVSDFDIRISDFGKYQFFLPKITTTEPSIRRLRRFLNIKLLHSLPFFNSKQNTGHKQSSGAQDNRRDNRNVSQSDKRSRNKSKWHYPYNMQLVPRCYKEDNCNDPPKKCLHSSCPLESHTCNYRFSATVSEC